MANAVSKPNRLARYLTFGWLGVFVLCLSYLFVKLVSFGPAVITLELTTEFQIGPVELSSLAAVYLWGYAAIQIPTGVLADTLGPRRAMAIFMLIAAIGTFIFAAAGSYPMGVTGRALMGVGTGIVFVCAAKLISNWFPLDRFATLNSLVVMTGYFGALIATAPLAWLVGNLGWRPSFIVVGAGSAFLALLAFALIRDHPKHVPAAPVGSKAPLAHALAPHLSISEAIKIVVFNRNLWLLAVYAVAMYGVLMALQGLWAVQYLLDVYHLPRQEASNMLTMWPIGIIIGCPFNGYLSDQVLRNRRTVLVAGSVVLAIPITILCLFTAGLPQWVFYGLFFVAGLGSSTMPVSYALLNDVLPRQVVGTATGVYNLWFPVGGAAIQTITGIMLSWFVVSGGSIAAEGYRAVFVLCLAIIVAALVAVMFTRERSLQAPETA